MRFSHVSRVAAPMMLMASLVGLVGCAHKGEPKGDYALAPSERPLEVPPEFRLPNADGSPQAPAENPSFNRSNTVRGAGFNLPGTRSEVFDQVGDALNNVEGLTVVTRAQLLGSFDVAYQGANFLVRVAEIPAGAYVSAVDPRGVPAKGPEATSLMVELKNQLVGN